MKKAIISQVSREFLTLVYLFKEAIKRSKHSIRSNKWILSIILHGF